MSVFNIIPAASPILLKHPLFSALSFVLLFYMSLGNCKQRFLKHPWAHSVAAFYQDAEKTSVNEKTCFVFSIAHKSFCQLFNAETSEWHSYIIHAHRHYLFSVLSIA